MSKRAKITNFFAICTLILISSGYYENLTKDLYLVFSFEVASFLGGAALYGSVAENATREENKREKHLLRIIVKDLKDNRFCFVGIKT